jgi:uncharacterized membrane protein YoaK (UPF0700 family)
VRFIDLLFCYHFFKEDKKWRQNCFYQMMQSGYLSGAIIGKLLSVVFIASSYFIFFIRIHFSEY